MDDHMERRTIKLPSPFTEAEARAEAKRDLETPQDGMATYSDVRRIRLAFN